MGVQPALTPKFISRSTVLLQHITDHHTDDLKTGGFTAKLNSVVKVKTETCLCVIGKVYL